MDQALTAAESASDEDRQQRIERFARRMRHPLVMRFYMLFKLPLGLMAGLRVCQLDATRCVASVPYGWRSTNPFRSTYFAALSMAAELSTGALALLAVEMAPANVALLVVGLEADFVQKATGLTTFTCEQGDEIFAAVAETTATGEPVSVQVETVGRAADGSEVARFRLTWSFKRRAEH